MSELKKKEAERLNKELCRIKLCTNLASAWKYNYCDFHYNLYCPEG